MKSKITNKKKLLWGCLIIGSFLATIKMLFQNYGMDEEYQVVMTYRLLNGDHLFLEMWEPHQTSTFLSYVFMWIYNSLFHTMTGVVIYLRTCGTLLHLGISYYLYVVIKKIIRKEESFLIALIFYNFIPKLIMLPEFAIMQVWFYTVLFLLLVQWKISGSEKNHYVVLMGLCMAGQVLSYPTTLIIFPFMIWVLCIFADKKIQTLLWFLGTCILSGILYLSLILSYMSFPMLIDNLQRIFQFDPTHGQNKNVDDIALIQGVITLCLYTIVIFLLTYAIDWALWKRKSMNEVTDNDNRVYSRKRVRVAGIAIIISCCAQVFQWVVLNSGFEKTLIVILIAGIAGLFVLVKEVYPYKKLLLIIMMGSFLELVAVMLVTNLPLVCSLGHSIGVAIFGMVIFAMVASGEEEHHLIRFVLIFLCFTMIIGKGYTLRGSADYNNVLQSQGILKYGPAIGTTSDYMGAYIYNSEYETWQNQIEEGSSVLVVNFNVFSASTTQYMFKNVNICNFSTIDPPVVNDKLLEYWKQFPEKYPDTIIVDCWYGNLIPSEDEWIVKYIENEFGYTSTYDGNYIRIYKKSTE